MSRKLSVALEKKWTVVSISMDSCKNTLRGVVIEYKCSSIKKIPSHLGIAIYAESFTLIYARVDTPCIYTPF